MNILLMVAIIILIGLVFFLKNKNFKFLFKVFFASGLLIMFNEMYQLFTNSNMSIHLLFLVVFGILNLVILKIVFFDETVHNSVSAEEIIS